MCSGAAQGDLLEEYHHQQHQPHEAPKTPQTSETEEDSVVSPGRRLELRWPHPLPCLETELAVNTLLEMSARDQAFLDLSTVCFAFGTAKCLLQ